MKILDEAFGLKRAMMTTIHAYTADQPLADVAGADLRRSRSAVENIIPNTFALKQNYPNPFNPNTSIEFEIDKHEYVKLIIYDINGRHVKTLADNYFSTGTHKLTWDSLDDYGNKVSSGLYIYQLILILI